MELGPITGIISLPVMKVPPAELGISAIFEVNRSPRSGDETYSGSGQSAAGQDDQEEEGQDTDFFEASGSESTDQPSDIASGSKVNYFA